MRLTFNRQLSLAYALLVGLIFAAGVVFALRISPVYTTDALLIPKTQSSASQISGGLATAQRLLGVSAADTNSDFSKFQQYWASRDVAQRLINKYPNLLPGLFGANWDESRHKWYDHPHTFRQFIAVPLNWLFGVYPSYTPSAQDLATYVKTEMVTDVDPQGTQIHITYVGPDAHFAQWFLGTVIAETDAAVRDAEQRRDKDFITFARDRLGRETNVAYRDALTDSLRQFEISNIYSEAGDNFCFQYVETPDLPLNHSAPKPLTYTLLAFVFANLVAASVVGTMMLWPTSRLARTVNAVCDPILHFTVRTVDKPPLGSGISEVRDKPIRRMS